LGIAPKVCVFFFFHILSQHCPNVVNDHTIVNLNSSNVVHDQIVVVNCPNVVKHPTVVNCPYK
jgi:hypothetical protein